MEKELELFELKLKTNADKVFAISIVDEPAIESNFMRFSKENEKQHFFTSEIGDQRILTGAAMIPNKKILRFNKATNEYYNITISEETIKEIAQKFFKEKFNTNTTIDHESKVDNTFYFESWLIANPQNDKSNELGFKDLPAGTWMVSLKVEDPELWSKIKEGNYHGFSIEGYFSEEKIKNEKQDMNIFEKIGNLFTTAKKDLIKLQIVDLTLEDGTVIKFDDETQEVKKADGSPLEDGDYTLTDGTKFTVASGKKVEDVVAQEEAPMETKTEDLADAPADSSTSGEIVKSMTLKDGTLVFFDENDFVRYDESGDILLDGDYTLEDDTVITIKDGLLVDATVASKEKELEKVKEEFASVKLNFEKELNEEKLKVSELNNKIVELEKEIEKLSNEPATEKTAINKEIELDLSKMSYHEQVAYNIKKQLKNNK